MPIHIPFIHRYVLLGIFLGLLCWLSPLHAQKGKGDKYYAKGEYTRAIPCYEKAGRKITPEQQEALLKLADCYLKLKEYNKAANAYKQALSLGSVPASVHYQYGNVLKCIGKYPEALQQYGQFLQEEPESALGKNALLSCQEIGYWQSKPREYEVQNAVQINTARSEFCPVVMGQELIFICDKQEDLVDFSTSTVDGQPYFSIYATRLDGKQNGKISLFAPGLNTPYYDGPVAVSADQGTLYFTRVSGISKPLQKSFVNRAKLYYARGEAHHWKNLEAFPYNSDDYSVAHPSESADGQWLFFSSDMPGGQGGKDIWVCRKNTTGWDAPQNLGPDINTAGDEMFPYIRKDGVLFFSSDGLPGFGGLDFYSASKASGIWVLKHNEGLLLNSSADDFGICFTSDSTGLFSSNREGGKGGDDLYFFSYKNKSITASGTLLLTESLQDPAPGATIYLLSESGEVLDSTKTDAKGHFEFRSLEADKKYMIAVSESDPDYQGKARFYLADEKNNIARVSSDKAGKKFVFRNLPMDPNGMPELFVEADLVMAGNLLYGENPGKPIANAKLVIRNETGDVLETTTTNELGAFAFRNLPTDQNYILSVEEGDVSAYAGAKITLTSKNGTEVKVVQADAKGHFRFQLLRADNNALREMKVADQDLIMTLDGYLLDQNRQPMASVKLLLTDKLGSVIEVVTDAKGRFQFKNLKADRSYIINVDESDPRMEGTNQLFIADAKNRVYKSLTKDKEGKFRFELLEVDKYMLATYTVDDPWLAVVALKNKAHADSITIVENIYYASGDWKVNANGLKVLDKVINIMMMNAALQVEISSHTDARSSDQYNLELSRKRAKAAVDYMVSRGIDRKRLKAIGYGETRLLNRCANGVDCSDEEHARNRRTEFKIVEVQK